MKKILAISFFALCFSSISAQNTIEGVWYNTTKTGKVEIYKEGKNYSGKIIWLKDPLDESTGKPKTDENNPNEKLRKTPIIGLKVLEGFTYDEDNNYSGGTIYDPENGKTYKCKMELKDENNLDVRGFIGFSFIGRTENWTRAK